MNQQNVYKEMFLTEAGDHVKVMSASLLELEKNPLRTELLNNFFRAVHTLKSMAATMEYQNTTSLCHTMEDLLDRVKKGEIQIEGAIDLLFECVDTLEKTLQELTKDRPELPTEELRQRLSKCFALDKVAESGLPRSKREGGVDAAGGGAVVGGEAGQLAASREANPTKPPDEASQTINVKIERLDLLMKLAEELLIGKMRLDRAQIGLENPELSAAVDSLSRVVTDIQYNVMQARMVPIGTIFDRFPRMVRDLAKQEGKEVELRMEGAELELDRSVLNQLGEPLVHLLRNAVDHGIEKRGTIRLSASRERESAVILVEDDGKGLDLTALRDSAVKRGMLPTGAAPEEVLPIIFSGISTAKAVTTISGRGLGLNIVKKKVESLGGHIEVESAPGKGTKFRIELPLTLAIVSTLFVRVGEEQFAIPLANVERLVMAKEAEIRGQFGGQAIILDQEDLPLIRLDILFQHRRSNHPSSQIVVVRRGQERVGLVVDSLMTTQEVVIKPLNRFLRESRYFSGSTIIGSGEVVLILDVGSLVGAAKKELKKEEVLI